MICARQNELHSSPQMRMLREGKLDAGFLTTTGPDELLEFKPVCHEAIVVAIPEHHRLAAEERIDLAPPPIASRPSSLPAVPGMPPGFEETR